jgi:hypothetical protein
MGLMMLFLDYGKFCCAGDVFGSGIVASVDDDLLLAFWQAN